MTNAHDRQSWFSELTQGRRSVRAFLPEQLSEAQLDQLLELSLSCPSWANTQPWHVYLLSGEAVGALSARLLDDASAPLGYEITPPVSFPEPFRARRKESGVALYKSLGIERGDTERAAAQSRENLRFFGAPHVAIITSSRLLGPYAHVDVGLFLGYLTLAAESLGIGATVQASVAGRAASVRAALDLPENETIVAAVALGFPDSSHPANQFRTARAPSTETVTRLRQLAAHG